MSVYAMRALFIAAMVIIVTTPFILGARHWVKEKMEQLPKMDDELPDWSEINDH